jgi:hypothetical protein
MSDVREKTGVPQKHDSENNEKPVGASLLAIAVWQTHKYRRMHRHRQRAGSHS